MPSMPSKRLPGIMTAAATIGIIVAFLPAAVMPQVNINVGYNFCYNGGICDAASNMSRPCLSVPINEVIAYYNCYCDSGQPTVEEM